MDIMKEFEEYLPIWSEEKHQPIPTMKHMDRWSVAWIDFVNEHLIKRKKELIGDYKSMEFKTRGELLDEKTTEEEEIEEIVEDTEEVIEPVADEHTVSVEDTKASEWERVRKMLYED